jgi:hypothetical protein
VHARDVGGSLATQTTMRIAPALVVLVLTLVTAGPGPLAARRADGALLVAAETLIGTWNGHWAAPAGGRAEGSVELILARAPGATACSASSRSSPAERHARCGTKVRSTMAGCRFPS